MKKSLIALAVAGVIAAPAAFADTTIYGSANLSYDNVRSGATDANGGSQSTNHISSNVSKIGFKGSEDLGDGLTAVWQMEEQVNMVSSGAGSTATANGGSVTSGTATFAARDTFAGLSSATLGTVIAGIHDTPYKMASRGFDLFADTIADNRSLMGNLVGDIRVNNALAYISPAFSGVTLAAATSFGGELPVASPAPSSKGSAWSLAALYGAGPLTVNAAYQTITIGDTGTGTLGAGLLGTVQGDKTTAFKLGGSYAMDAFQVNAVYEKLGSSGTGVSNALDRTNFYLAGKFNLNANDTVKAAYTRAGNSGDGAGGTADASGAKQFSLGYDHNLSKHTSVYALYSKLSNDTNAGYTFSQATSVNGAPGSANAAPSVLSLGMKHAF